MDRVFLDANVLVSAALKPDSVLHELWERPGIRLLGSPHVLAEVRRNVAGESEVERLEELLAFVAVLPAEPADFPIDDDPGLPAKDRPVLLAAIVTGADYLLTGDASHFGGYFGRTVAGIRIARPGEYLRER